MRGGKRFHWARGKDTIPRPLTLPSIYIRWTLRLRSHTCAWSMRHQKTTFRDLWRRQGMTAVVDRFLRSLDASWDGSDEPCSTRKRRLSQRENSCHTPKRPFQAHRVRFSGLEPPRRRVFSYALSVTSFLLRWMTPLTAVEDSSWPWPFLWDSMTKRI